MLTQKACTVTITFPLMEQTQVITSAEHDLLVNHLSRNEAIEFIRLQYALQFDAAEAIVEAVRATLPTITRLPDRKVEVRYPGAEYILEVTQAEYNMIPSLSTVQATKFIRDQHSGGLYKAKRCVDAARAIQSV